MNIMEKLPEFIPKAYSALEKSTKMICFRKGCKNYKLCKFYKGGGPRWRSQGRIKSLAKLSACFIPQTPYPLFLSPAPSHINISHSTFAFKASHCACIRLRIIWAMIKSVRLTTFSPQIGRGDQQS